MFEATEYNRDSMGTARLSVGPFSLSALERIATIIGDRYTGSEITAFFKKAGFGHIRHDGSTKWRFVYAALEDLQHGRDGPYQVAKVIQQLCDPQEYFGDAEVHNDIVKRINEVLAFYQLEANPQDGKIRITGRSDAKLSPRESEDAKLFESRGLHLQIRKHGRLLFLEGHYFHAVFECCKAFDKYVGDKSLIDKHGSDLMSNALSLRGSLKLNTQQTESERNEQEGVMHLCMGLMRAIRNPESHEPELDWPIDRADATDMLSLISYLYRQVDGATVYQA